MFVVIDYRKSMLYYNIITYYFLRQKLLTMVLVTRRTLLLVYLLPTYIIIDRIINYIIFPIHRLLEILI